MAFFHSPAGRQPIFNAPSSVLGLIAVLVAIHLAVTFLPVPDWLLASMVFVPVRYASPYIHTVPLYDLVVPLFGHQLLHGSWTHLIVNSLWLLAFGPVVARRYGGLWFLGFFFLCGAAGALTEMAFAWGSTAAMVGASGAVSGLMGAAFRMMHWPGVPAGVRLVPLWSRSLLLISVLWLVGNALVGIAGLGLDPTDGSIRIAWQAHMGGYLFGLLTIGLIDRLHRPAAVVG
jgi:membrane associated rhomboid family serine protease